MPSRTSSRPLPKPAATDSQTTRRPQGKASVQARRNGRGEITSYRLMFRLDGRLEPLSFGTEREAEHWKKIFDTVGVERALAMLRAEAKAEAAAEDAANGTTNGSTKTGTKTKVYTVKDAVEVTIDNLTGVEDGYIDRCRAEAQRHIFDMVVTVDDTDFGGVKHQMRLGDVALHRLDAQIIRSWIKALTKTKRVDRAAKGRLLSPKTVKNRHGLLSQSLTFVLNEKPLWGLTKNHAYKIKLPTIVRREHVYLHPHEIRMILEAIDQRFKDFLLVLLGTGMRWSEATALRKYGVREHEGYLELTIDTAWKDVRKGPQKTGGPKTRKGQRKIPVPTGTPVHAAIKRAIADKGNDDLVFTSPHGKQLRNAEFHDAFWGPMKQRLLPIWNGRFPVIHDLRHNFASTLIGRGVDIITVAQLLGHEKVQTTLDVYGHLLPGNKEKGMGVMASELAVMLAAPAPTLPQRRKATPVAESEDQMVEEFDDEGESIVYAEYDEFDTSEAEDES